ncbi:Dolichyl-phosphate-mannose-- mannosyltransferase 2 [Fusarium albosuccineum]|uniref:Dolichyl-phosphate-mannose-- mannosyltransferase 2 n=1 Tax=Fusarium albosuccineum TaxID=1237068 RepID=A0A8H4PA22_9HYPO|nr:Dolichyl-phosphate-mannose-- mannosyltransferase 2 [Fusarium albosuccineum]
MARTITRDDESIFIPFGGLNFGPKSSKSTVVNIVFRTGDNIPSTGLHWHETHTEYLQVVQGYALVTVGDRTAVFTKDDGVITIPRYTIHQYSRADNTEEGKAGKTMDLMVREWTDPADGDKEVFFRNIISLLKDKKDTVSGTIGMLFSIMVVAWAHDNYPVFWQGPGFLGKSVQGAPEAFFYLGRIASNTIVVRADRGGLDLTHPPTRGLTLLAPVYGRTGLATNLRRSSRSTIDQFSSAVRQQRSACSVAETMRRETIRLGNRGQEQEPVWMRISESQGNPTARRPSSTEKFN